MEIQVPAVKGEVKAKCEGRKPSRMRHRGPGSRHCCSLSHTEWCSILREVGGRDEDQQNLLVFAGTSSRACYLVMEEII